MYMQNLIQKTSISHLRETHRLNSQENIQTQINKISNTLQSNCQQTKQYYSSSSPFYTAFLTISPCFQSTNASSLQQNIQDNASKQNKQRRTKIGLRGQSKKRNKLSIEMTKKAEDLKINQETKNLQSMVLGVHEYEKKRTRRSDKILEENMFIRKRMKEKSELHIINNSDEKKQKEQVSESMSQKIIDSIKYPQDAIKKIDKNRDYLLSVICPTESHESNSYFQNHPQAMHIKNFPDQNKIAPKTQKRNQQEIFMNLWHKKTKNRHLDRMKAICTSIKNSVNSFDSYTKEVGNLTLKVDAPFQTENIKIPVKNIHESNSVEGDSIPESLLGSLIKAQDISQRNRSCTSRLFRRNPSNENFKNTGFMTPNSTSRNFIINCNYSKICQKIRQVSTKEVSRSQRDKKCTRMFSDKCFVRHQANQKPLKNFQYMIKYF